MLLLIDIGNTNITTGFFHDNEIKSVVRTRSKPENGTFDELIQLIDEYARHLKLEGAVLCSVVPETAESLIELLSRSYGFSPLVLSAELKTGLTFKITNREGLGADRIANAVAARNLYTGNLIVIDFGTATTVCVITEDGEYRGGAIMPGLAMSADALADYTAKLPRVGLKSPSKILGGDTIDNILAGLVYGHAGAIERIIKEIRKEIEGDMTVIATGGLSDIITPHASMIEHVNPLLTLEGLKYIHRLNS